MLRRLLPLTILVSATLMVTTQVHADATADAKKVIATDYAKIDAASNRKDAAGMIAFYSPDYTYTAKSGMKVTLEQVKQQTHLLTANLKSIKAKTLVQTFKMNGNNAVATIKEHAELTVVNPQNNQPMSIVLDSVKEDTWIKSGAKWLMKHTKETSQKVTQNGKPLGGK